jgi:hypothetical protein
MQRIAVGCAVALLTLGLASNARADLVFTTSLEVSGSGLGAVNTIVTVHDSGGGAPGTNGTEGGCINQDGTETPCLDGVTEHDNLAQNHVVTMANTTNFAAVVNLSETGNDKTVTLTNLYLTFCGIGGCYTATYKGGPIDLTQGSTEGTGLGGSGFTFELDPAQFLLVQALGPTVTVSGGVQFAHGSTNDGNETLYLVAVAGATPGPAPVPEPASLTLFGLGLTSASYFVRRRKAASNS